jgi:hypothetical protein
MNRIPLRGEGLQGFLRESSRERCVEDENASRLRIRRQSACLHDIWQACRAQNAWKKKAFFIGAMNGPDHTQPHTG